MATKPRQPKKAVTADLAVMLKGFPALFAGLDQEHKQIVTRMAELDRAGLKRATLFWRKKVKANGEEVQFLYLHYPTKADGSRPREYIGADPAKVDAAKAAVERVKEHDELASKLKTLNERIAQISDALQTARDCLENKRSRSRWGYNGYGYSDHHEPAYAH